jgi:predicted outer membrane protein
MALLLVVGSLSAQDNQTSKANSDKARVTSAKVAAEAVANDQTFAHCLAIANQEQVLLSRFVRGKVVNSEVQAFAAMLEKEHQASVEQLQGLAPKFTAIENLPAIAAKPPAAAQSSVARVTNSANTVDFLALHQEISNQCLRDGQEMLSAKKGIEIDQCFVGMQIAKHAAAHSVLTVLQRHASSELQAWIKTDLETNAKHLQAATKLMQKLAEIEATGSLPNNE